MWRVLSWKKLLLVICKTSLVFVNTLTSNDNYSLLNRDNLTLPIHMQLSQNQKFFRVFFNFWNLHEVLNISKQKMTLIANVFLKLRTPKTWLDKYLKSPVSEEPSTSNRGRFQNTFEIWMTAILPDLLINVKAIELEQVSLSDMQNLRTLC